MAWTIRTHGPAAVVVGMNSNKVNAQDEGFLRDLAEALDTVERDHRDRAMILASEARCFSAGLDFDAIFGLFTTGSLDDVIAFMERYTGGIMRLFTLAQPTAAAIDGHAYAGGLVLAAACDLRIAVERAVLAFNEVPIGIAMPAAYVEMIRYAAGSAGAARTMLLGEELTARTARELGVVHEVVAGDPIAGAAALLARHTGDAAAAYAYTKRALQADAVARMRAAIATIDRTELPGLLGAPATRRLLAERYRRIKGVAPSWAPAE